MKYLKIISLTIVLFMFGCSAKKSDLDLLTIPKKDYEFKNVETHYWLLPGDDEDVRLPDYMGNALTNYNCKFILPDKFGYRLMGIGDFDIHPDCYSDLNGSIQINIKNAILKEDNDPESYRYHMIQELFEGKPEKYEKELIGIMQVFDSSVEVISEKTEYYEGRNGSIITATNVVTRRTATFTKEKNIFNQTFYRKSNIPDIVVKVSWYDDKIKEITDPNIYNYPLQIINSLIITEKS